MLVSPAQSSRPIARLRRAASAEISVPVRSRGARRGWKQEASFVSSPTRVWARLIPCAGSKTADILLASAVDDVRTQITLYAALGQMVYDTYVAMSEKTPVSSNIGVPQSLADGISTIGLFLGKFMPGTANAVGWAAGVLTKKGDFIITLSRDQMASSDDIEAWTDDSSKPQTTLRRRPLR